ncbi:MAG: tRNA uridine-5-carboxymethylaminomethyl(34) synthesis GTPase MnmE [Candidatus Krumholzibacteriia bacterium]
MYDDTIVALATAAGAAGLAVVRISGPEALEIGARLFEGADLTKSPSHRAHHGFLVDGERGERIDEVLALVLRAPHSYTGEDTVEFSCHGSPQVVDEIVAVSLAAGARLAEAGEFTRRAFLSGKLDLCQAEAVADLIESQSRAARRAALEQLRGRLSDRLRAARGDLVALLADIEASIDFVEEGIEFFGRDEAGRRGASAAARVDELLATADDGMLLRSGIRVSVAGSPNVGKSRLFNRILRSPRSIVTEHAGTTRDVVRETVRLGGVVMVLEDTAGLRGAARDPVEAIGIERSRQSHAEADIVLYVVDATKALEDDESGMVRGLDAESTIVVVNKVDLLPEERRRSLVGGVEARREFAGELGLAGHALPECLAVSAATGEGVESLLDALLQTARVRRLAFQNDALVTINQRHREALVRARQALATFERDVRTDEPPEILAADLRTAVAAFSEISGEQISEEILDSIFSRFCIGK